MRWVTAFACLLILACREKPAPLAVAAATPAPALTETPALVVIEPVPTPREQSAEFVMPASQPGVRAPPPPTVTLAPAEPMERPREPTPENLHEQLARCLVFQAEKDQRPITTLDYHAVTARVKARNDCDTALPGEEAWIEVRAIVPVGGRGLIGREYARFQGPIPARSSAETFVRIENSAIDPYEFYRFDVALWWAAGSGRRPE